MGFFDRFRKKADSLNQEVHNENLDINTNSNPIDNLELDMTLEVSKEEKEVISVIASAIASGDNPDSTFKVKSIKRIDTDKEIAAAIVSAVATGDNPNSSFRLKSIKEIKNKNRKRVK
ncbi:hypothetical protein [Tissierella sp. Yu-01]|uniref:hypothetical protein n=1 Tax=Tissierella sp. Yu-01 TaxID=3035694 RepID=UPI00240DA564|nr:hypothetical protein [Tissierella sp. Yu-01]WFA08135.1 hypothetical protein P3962_10380 [Tissierella sp. Yu-01]